MHRIGITGHRGFDLETSRVVVAALRRLLARYGPGDLTGVSCLADGADTLFAEAVAARGGRLEVVIPARRYREYLPESHRETYDELLSRADAVHRLDFVESDAEAFMAGSECMLGLVDCLIAVWDGAPARGHGGTAEVVAEARRRGVPVEVVWPAGAVRA